MQFLAKTVDITSPKTQCAIAFVYSDKTLSTGANALDKASNGAVKALIASGDIKLKTGQAAWIPSLTGTNFQRILVVCIGSKKKPEPESSYISCAQVIARSLETKPIKSAIINLDDINIADRDLNWAAETLSKTLVSSAYRYTTTKPAKEEAPALTKLTCATSDKTQLKALRDGLVQGSATGDGINLAKELGNLPGNFCTPTDLANTAKKLASQYEKVSAKIVEEKQMEKLGMGSLLSVTAGSSEPAKLIVMEYKGKASKSPNVLVGKGITFDTGGISLKPGAGMDEMKFDMCGAASVFGVIKALSEMKANVHVVGVVAAAENMPNGDATKPGDVVTSMAGKTIEVLNTDAEGRLVLCDALTYVERFKPKTVIDIATLTGACVVALGKHATGLYANNQDLADKLIASGTATNDRAWQMPLWDEYKKQLTSNFADLANIGGRDAGSVTAACFLSHFTEKYKWAHLDIAGTAWHSGGAKGATGRPVSLLVNFLLNN